MRLFLARHGETPWNLEQRWQGHTDIPLSPRGQEQAAALAERLRSVGIGQIRASDLLRARETAEIVGRTLGIAGVTVDPRLRERSFGVFEGLTADECLERHADAWNRYQADRACVPPGGEPQAVVVARLRAGVLEAAAAAAEAPVLVVGHGGAFRALLHDSFGRPFPPMANGNLLRLEVHDGQLREIEDLGA